MMIHAWDSYKLYAWGKSELRPVSKRSNDGSLFGAYDLGATIVDGLDTLYLMGLTKEFEDGRHWIAQQFTLENLVSICLKFIYFNLQLISILVCGFFSI